MATGQGGRMTRTGRGCIDLGGGRESIRGWGAGTCSGADLLDPGGLQIRQDQRNQRAVPTSVPENRAEERRERETGRGTEKGM